MYDTSALLDNLKATLDASVATLTASLTTSYPLVADCIRIGNPTRITRQLDQYPCIIINPKNKSQEWDEIGQNSSSKMARQLTISVDILAMTQCMSDTEDADRQARTLARNIESVLETNIEKQASTSTVEDSWHSCIVTNAVYENGYTESGQTYQSTVRLETEFKVWGYR